MKQFLSRIFEPKEHAPEAAFHLINLLNAKISWSTIKQEMLQHPDYPSFLSISDILNNHNIENVVARFDDEKLVDLPTPFIAQIKGTKDILQYTVVKEINQNQTHYFDPEKQKWSKNDTKYFLKNTNGIALLAEADDNIVEKNYKEKIHEEKRVKISQYLIAFSIPLILLISSLLVLTEFGMISLLPILFSIVTLGGVLVTTLLLWYEIDQNNLLLQHICSSGKKTNCGAILKSKEAKIFGISWSVIGFVYFTGSLIALLTLGITNTGILKILSYLNLAAVPYIIYSIYYQWKIAKQWCILCLTVQVILALQCTIAVIAGWHGFPIANDFLLKIGVQILTSFAIPFIISSLLLPALRGAKESNRVTMELQRLKHNPEIFNAILEKQRFISDYPDGLGIIMGNPNATHKIIKVCNPYCGPCADAHRPMDELLSINPDLQLQIIFTATNDPTDKRSQPVKHLLAIDDKFDKEIIHQALGDWYLADVKDYATFSNKYPMNGELKNQEHKIEAMTEWCKKTEIKFTPTFFINGHELPANYNVNDLKYFLSM
ncbi:MAG TPA: vitamin K epoxide reductase family protein [Pedobacter sp.]|uniref:vitamin K epoxide reductase family protein n=1 Tax=Pedobacter sp. TaxID=1411316 RepID=UPI002CF7EEA1|nr:vitamin K epoxide reductase family protein [Pedobacter sp.]HMI02720.1 vitamin K epoxide reductase family protein [Pedobacter sp.]